MKTVTIHMNMWSSDMIESGASLEHARQYIEDYLKPKFERFERHVEFRLHLNDEHAQWSETTDREHYVTCGNFDQRYYVDNYPDALPELSTEDADDRMSALIVINKLRHLKNFSRYMGSRIGA